MSHVAKGYAKLMVDGVLGVTEAVEAMHATISTGVLPFGEPHKQRTRGLTGLVYTQIRAATELLNALVLADADTPTRPTPPSESSLLHETIAATINGVVGDYLEATGNPLAIPMSFRQHGRPLDLADLGACLERPTGKLALMVGGLCMNDRMWTYQGHDHGAALQADLGYTPVYLRYNTGRHVSTNGRELAEKLAALLAAWPMPLEEVVVVAHSLGGLVTRSALHYAAEAGHAWPKQINKVVYLGTPHHGAPLERGGHWVQWAAQVSAYTAPIAKLARLRSAAITDLRYGYLLDEDWRDISDRFATCTPPARVPALPAHIRHYAIAGTLGKREKGLADLLLGDGMVPLDSALGRHKEAARTLAFAPERQWVGYGLGHIDLICHPEAYAALRAMVAE